MPKTKTEFISKNGDVMVVPKSKLKTEEPVVVVSQTEANKIRQKRPMTEKQKEALDRLIERNRKRWTLQKEVKNDDSSKIIEEKVVIKEPLNIPKEVSPDETVVIVKPKRQKKAKSPVKVEIISQKEIPVSQANSPIPKLKAPGAPKKVKKFVEPDFLRKSREAEPESDTEYTSSTSVVEDTEEEILSDSDEEEEEAPPKKVKKYTRKVEKKLDALKKIEEAQRKYQTLMGNKYAKNGLSIF